MIEERSRPRSYASAPLRVITAHFTGAGDRLRSVERVVQASPTGIGGIEQETRMEDGHHELRAGDPCNFGIDLGGIDCERRRLIDQIADRPQELLIRVLHDRFAGARNMPCVEPGLERVAL